MPIHEYRGNIHIHTPYSDGHLNHEQVAAAAIEAGLDFIIVTDHNVLVRGVEGYYGQPPEKAVLLLTGEEIHDQARLPQSNHLLVLGAPVELAQHAYDPQALINAVNEAGGLAYISHPHDPSALKFGEPDMQWVSWDVEGYHGIEIWNYMSEFKGILTTPQEALRIVDRPERFITGPYAETLAQWDKLLSEGKKLSAIGGSDAHGKTYTKGPITRVVFPYRYLFDCINTHLLSPQPLTGDFAHDQEIIYKALRNGSTFVGYDLIARPDGFRFSAAGHNANVIMGGEIRLGHGVTLQAIAPERARILLIRQGEIVAEEPNGENLTYTASQPGAYRIEVWQEYEGKQRGWIFSSPIYVAG